MQTSPFQHKTILISINHTGSLNIWLNTYQPVFHISIIAIFLLMTSWTDRTTEPDASTAWCLFIALRPAFLREFNYTLQCTFGEQELIPTWLFTLTTTCFLLVWASACAHMFVHQVHFKTVLPLETLLVGSLVQEFLIKWENETHACYTPLFPHSGVNWRSFRSGWLACLVKVHSLSGHPGKILHICNNWNSAGSSSSKMVTLDAAGSDTLIFSW